MLVVQNSPLTVITPVKDNPNTQITVDPGAGRYMLAFSYGIPISGLPTFNGVPLPLLHTLSSPNILYVYGLKNPTIGTHNFYAAASQVSTSMLVVTYNNVQKAGHYSDIVGSDLKQLTLNAQTESGDLVVAAGYYAGPLSSYFLVNHPSLYMGHHTNGVGLAYEQSASGSIPFTWQVASIRSNMSSLSVSLEPIASAGGFFDFM